MENSARRSYLRRMFVAEKMDDWNEVNRITNEGYADVVRSLSQVVGNYSTIDLPLVLATMKVVEMSLEGLLDEDGHKLEKMFEKKLCITAIDVDGVLRQSKGKNDDGDIAKEGDQQYGTH